MTLRHWVPPPYQGKLSVLKNSLSCIHFDLICRMLCTNTTLSSLDLSYNSVGNTGALALESAENTTIRNLDLRMNHVSHEVLSTIEQKLIRNRSTSIKPEGDEGDKPQSKMQNDPAITKLPPLSKNLDNGARTKQDTAASGVFGSDGNCRFQQAVLDRYDIRQ